MGGRTKRNASDAANMKTRRTQVVPLSILEEVRDQILEGFGNWDQRAKTSKVHFDHDEEMEPMPGMYGTLDAELELQRTIKGAALTATLLVFVQKGYRVHHGSC